MDGINSFTCQCPLGFTGPFCLTEINECDSHPCLNKGSCVDSLGTYRCLCPLGYTGKNCQVGGVLLPCCLNFPTAEAMGLNVRYQMWQSSCSFSSGKRCLAPLSWEKQVQRLCLTEQVPPFKTLEIGTVSLQRGEKCLVIYEDRCHRNFLDQFSSKMKNSC